MPANTLRAVVAAVAALCLAAATAGAHPLEEHGAQRSASAASLMHLLHMGAGAAFAPLGPVPTATSPVARGENPTAMPGPCTEAAKQGMPDSAGHDHADVTQHRDLRCRIEQAAFLPLRRELADRPDVVLGEMDIEADIAAVAVIWPEGGLLFFDVSDPTSPEFLSWYRSTQCEGAAIANNCGAFVDLSGDGRTAYIAQQSLTFLPGPDPDTVDVGPLPATTPGVEVVDATDPRRPRRKQVLPVLSQGGVHTARWHAIPGEGPGPRQPGEYVFAIANSAAVTQGSGIDISRVNAQGLLTPHSRIEIGETHDTFIQNDPDGRTYLYIAGGFSKGLLVYDVTSPASPRLVANWNITPECTRDWYSHTVDVVHRNGRRFVTMPAELFTSGAQSAAQRAQGCGSVVGNGDQPGPLWIIDATDFGALGQPGESTATLKQKSERALVATWTNPAGRAAGNLTFSPHNQQVVGDRIYLSDYHGGVFVLDASGAFARRNERPRELGHIVPNGESSNAEARPLAGPQSPAPTAAPRTRGRSSIWDMVVYKGAILAADQVGGFYSLVHDDSADTTSEVSPPAVGRGDSFGADCGDRIPPVSRVVRGGARFTRRGLALRGRSADVGCRGIVSRVRVSVARATGRRCRFLRANGRFTPLRSCLRTTYLSARGTSAWGLRMAARLPRGRYKVWVRGIDASGNVERKNTRQNFRRARVR